MAGSAGKKKESLFWGWLDLIKGDKVIWIIVILLTMFSVIALFSSTSTTTEVSTGRADRVDLFKEQLKMIAVGFALLLVCYFIPGIRLFRKLSQLGFIASMALLLPLFMHINADLPKDAVVLVRAQNINNAWRTLFIAGKVQLHVFEIVKVMMVLYLSWAVHALAHYGKKDKVTGKEEEFGFGIVRHLARKYDRLAFLEKPVWLAVVYIFIPIMLVATGLMSGSVSTVLFVGGIMFATLFIGGFDVKQILIFAGIMAGLVFLGFLNYKALGTRYDEDEKIEVRKKKASEKTAYDKIYLTFDKVYGRFDTASSRIKRYASADEGKSGEIDSSLSIDEQLELADGTGMEQEIIDHYLQTESAKIAIKEGGLIGKGPGKSTQKYRVPLIFGDYMYCFIIEEYGLLGGIVILILFVSLMARGAKIALNCESIYARTAVGGLTILISGQAMMHMLINVGLLPITGQTLPMISEGKSSLLMFYVAFGILLSISKLVKKQMDKEAAKIPDIVPDTGDEVADSIADIEELENQIS